jgi:hypothetical protein
MIDLGLPVLLAKAKSTGTSLRFKMLKKTLYFVYIHLVQIEINVLHERVQECIIFFQGLNGSRYTKATIGYSYEYTVLCVKITDSTMKFGGSREETQFQCPEVVCKGQTRRGSYTAFKKEKAEEYVGTSTNLTRKGRLRQELFTSDRIHRKADE